MNHPCIWQHDAKDSVIEALNIELDCKNMIETETEEKEETEDTENQMKALSRIPSISAMSMSIVENANKKDTKSKPPISENKWNEYDLKHL